MCWEFDITRVRFFFGGHGGGSEEALFDSTGFLLFFGRYGILRIRYGIVYAGY